MTTNETAKIVALLEPKFYFNEAARTALDLLLFLSTHPESSRLAGPASVASSHPA
jgi:hypothetical protein